MDDKLKKLILLMEVKNEEKFSDFSKSIEQLDKQDIELSNDIVLLYKELSKIEDGIKSFDVSEQIKELKSDIENIQLQKGDKGDKGDSGKDGLNGKDGRDGLDGLNGKDGERGDKGDSGSPDTPEQIVEKINTLENVIDIKTIKDFPKIEGNADIKRQVDTIGNQVLRLLSRPKTTGGGGTWGSITGTLSDQTDLQSALNAKQDSIITGTSAQYLKGDLSLGTFPTLVSSFTNDSGYITSSALTGYVPNTRTLTINGTAYDLSADRSWTVAVPTLTSELTNDSGFITSSALASYLPLTGATYTTTTGNGLALTTSTLTSGKLVSLSSTGTGAGSNTQTVLNIATSGANGTSTQTTYGTYVTNTHTGTASTNVAGYFSASGGTNNYGLIVANGNVGIGMTGPSYKLDVQDTTVSAAQTPVARFYQLQTTNGYGNPVIIRNADASAYSTSAIGFQNAAGTTVFQAGAAGSTYSNAAYPALTANGSFLYTTGNFGMVSDNVTGRFYFQIGQNAAGVKMSILSSGNVGIGTTSPGYKLDIQGAAAETSLTNTTNNYRISFGFPSASGGEPSLSAFTTGVTNGRIFQRQNSTKDVFMGDIDANGGGVHIRTNGNDSLNILSGGNVGIGQSSPTAVLHLKAGTATANTAPLKFTTGTNLTTAEAGVMEFTTDNLYFTITTGVARKKVTLDEGLTSGRVPFATTNGRLTDDADMTFATDTLTVTKIVGATSVKVGTAAGYISSDGSTGATGIFTTVDLKTVTVKDGIITSIV